MKAYENSGSETAKHVIKKSGIRRLFTSGVPVA
ncbi:hypothetical protein BSUW23_06450 [Bacillus spizizenii str. W23]|uniref:Uncharacterized protein n=1 Tax=Bacillus spizizenii (strain ATCC 23059 / NRRL B-14472 / W23) TaxID=655816 RepID=E0U1S5_BACSH|nr:hypothetical protein BSUW23_06450 [Bacillus spizizenii str. W23]